MISESRQTGTTTHALLILLVSFSPFPFQISDKSSIELDYYFTTYFSKFLIDSGFFKKLVNLFNSINKINDLFIFSKIVLNT